MSTNFSYPPVIDTATHSNGDGDSSASRGPIKRGPGRPRKVAYEVESGSASAKRKDSKARDDEKDGDKDKKVRCAESSVA